ncbi:YjfI family protein [Pseudomonas sp. MWU13-2100]|uniref:YjfI family protein n=1 Tax=Pseudomonas sp. MWU13-2100 TaxID=2935075 RepID=UPI00200C2D4E|nr:YjfI family protein [Pseudomonas sp. MWU13-2100]
MPRRKAADDKPLSGGKTSSPAKPKTTADYVRDMRTRLRDAGLVKREFWILPENATALRGIEKALRQPFLGERIKLEAFMTENINWTINSLHKALSELEVVSSGEIVLTLAENAEQSIKLSMTEFGDLPLYLAVSGDQILVDATLVEVSRVKDPAVFNNLVLRSRDLFPLSSVGIERVGDGTEVYCMFGALSAASTITVIVQEIFTLAENVIRAVEAFEDHIHV